MTTTKRHVADMDVVIDKLRPFMAMQSKEAAAKLDEAHVRRRLSLLARAAGDDRALLTVLRRSAVDADVEQGGESNPSGFLAHEQIADTLMSLKQPKEAAVEYALALRQHPGRAHSLLGAARAAAQAGSAAVARTWYQRLLEVWSAADEGTAGLAEARAAVAATN